MLLLLAGCEKPITRGDADAIARDAAGDAYDSRVTALETKVDQLEASKATAEANVNEAMREIEEQRLYIDAVQNQVSGNAKVYNQHLRAER